MTRQQGPVDTLTEPGYRVVDTGRGDAAAGVYPADMELGLRDKVVLVLGASQGMGLAIAEAFAAEGATVAMAARRAEVLGSEAARIRAHAFPADLTVAAERERLVAGVVEQLGGLDVLVLNGGGPAAAPAAGTSAAAALEAAALLLAPVVHLVDLALPHLRAGGDGRIVAIQSSSVREPIPNLALSNAIRPGVVGWLKTLAREVAADGITVNTILPGRIATDRLLAIYGPDGPPLDDVPAGRLGSAAEIAAVAVFLAGAPAAYVTGASIPVDGGLLRALA